MSKKCKQDGCNNNVYKELTKCILHCEKSNYSVDFNKIGFLENFNDELIKYIAKELNKYNSSEIGLGYDDFVKYFTNEIKKTSTNDIKKHNIIEAKITSHTTILNYIIFPNRKSTDSFDYIKVLQKVNGVHFDHCEFQTSFLEIEQTKVFFQNCIFHDTWTLNNFKIIKSIDNINNVLYQNCTFKNEISSGAESDKLELEAIQFKDCKFTEIHFENTVFKKQIFKNGKEFRGSLETLYLYDCVIEDKFIFNRHKLGDFRLQNTVFKDEFEFKDNADVEVVITNINFEGFVDFYNTDFKHFFADKSIFHEFSGFEMCTFGSQDLTEPIKFKHITFLSFISFRDAKFYAGLDMRDTNLKEYPNFLDAYINPENTDKETFRIIKYSFDKIGNMTEGNKYFSYEMAKERKKTYFLDNPEKKIILWFNFIISNFGQSFLLPLFWIFILGIIHHFVDSWLDNTTIYEIFANYNVNYENIKIFINSLNDFAKNILPFKRFLPQNKEFISLLFLIGYSTLIYHFIVAIKRMIKR